MALDFLDFLADPEALDSLEVLVDLAWVWGTGCMIASDQSLKNNTTKKTKMMMMMNRTGKMIESVIVNDNALVCILDISSLSVLLLFLKLFGLLGLCG